MAIISTIGVSVTARTDKFRKGMKSAQTTLTSFTAAATKFGLAAGAAVAGGLALMVRSASKSIDAISKLSDLLNVSTESIVGLQLAARLTGVAVKTMDASLAKMVKRIGAVTRGTGAAKNALKQLGLSANDLAAMKADVAFGVIADSINGLGTQAEKASVAFDIFGKAGIDLLNTLKLGSEGLRLVRADAIRMGLAFSRAEGAGVEAMNDALDRLKLTLGALSIDFTVKVAPAITSVANTLTELIITMRASGVTVFATTKFVVKYGGALLAVVGTITAINIAMKVWAIRTKLVTKALALLQSVTLGPIGIAKVAAGIAAGAASLIAIDRIFKSMGDEAEEAASKTRDLRTEMDELAGTRDRKFGGRFGIRTAKQFTGLTGVQSQTVARESRSRNTDRLQEETNSLLQRILEAGGGLAA